MTSLYAALQIGRGVARRRVAEKEKAEKTKCAIEAEKIIKELHEAIDYDTKPDSTERMRLQTQLTSLAQALSGPAKTLEKALKTAQSALSPHFMQK